MRHITRHIYPIGLDLASLAIREKYSRINPELAILKLKRREWRESGSNLSLDEWLMTCKKELGNNMI